MGRPSKMPGFTRTSTWKLWAPTATSVNCHDNGPRAVPPTAAAVSDKYVVFGDNDTFAQTYVAARVPVLLKHIVYVRGSHTPAVEESTVIPAAICGPSIPHVRKSRSSAAEGTQP